MKIIDCFAASLPVISTSKWIEGIPVVSGLQALRIYEWEFMMDAICELWEDREKAQSLARKGRQMAESLDWDQVAQEYLSVYSALSR